MHAQTLRRINRRTIQLTRILDWRAIEHLRNYWAWPTTRSSACRRELAIDDRIRIPHKDANGCLLS